MGIVFDEVVGQVQSQDTPAQAQDTPSQAAAPQPNQPPLQQHLRHLRQRAARLQAD